MAGFLQQFSQDLSATGFGKKALLVLLLAAGLTAVIVIGLWTQEPDYQVLFSELSVEDTGAVVNQLKESKTPYKLSSNGSGILVPSNEVHELRLQLASEGLPQSGGVGFEIFDRNTIGVSEFVQKLNYNRALQGELSRTITQLDEIVRARVHLVVPEKTLFSNNQEEPRASVIIRLRSGRALSSRQIQGIIHLVSSSVQGMKPEGISLIDSHGQLLSKGSQDSSSSIQVSQNHSDFQRNFDLQMERKLQTLLEKVVGVNKAVVRVSSVLDLRQVEMTEEKYDPDSQVARSEQRTQEVQTGSSKATGGSGIPGVLSNDPATSESTSPSGPNTQNSLKKKDELINYEISKSTSRVIEPFGTVKNLSIAVLIDGTYETITNENGETTRQYIPREETEMNKLEELVKKAMGFSSDRQDQLEVVNIPFQTEPLIDVQLTGPDKTFVEQLSQWWPLARLVVGMTFVLLLFQFILRPILTALLAPATRPFPVGSPEFSGGTMTGALPQALPNREEMTQIARKNPQAAATVVRKWLKEK